ncbi:hypothetical protein VTK73DRAFT_3908 [Phialemonium thermophilum]|uniref:Uncharacterized protein n=1 Tax=Phialemonium thermophilum TaxID=223376 RepID=A0ABR3VDE8_9PEZI
MPDRAVQRYLGSLWAEQASPWSEARLIEWGRLHICHVVQLVALTDKAATGDSWRNMVLQAKRARLEGNRSATTRTFLVPISFFVAH